MNTRNFLVNLVVNMLSISLTAYILPGITVPPSFAGLIIIALVFGLVNALVRPIITILSLPFIVVTFGLFLLVLNGLMLYITAAISPLEIAGFWSAVGGAIIISLINMVLYSFLQEDAQRSVA